MQRANQSHAYASLNFFPPFEVMPIIPDYFTGKGTENNCVNATPSTFVTFQHEAV